MMLRAVLLFWMFLAPAHATEPAERPIAILKGRRLLWAGTGMFAVAAPLMAISGGLTIYAPPRSIARKATYDRIYLSRFNAASYMGLPAGGLTGLSTLLVSLGGIIEARGLQEVTTLTAWPAILGLTLTSVGLTVGTLGSLGSTALIAIGGGTAVLGATFSWVQMGLNNRAARALGPDRRRELYTPPEKVQVTVVPIWQEGGGGLAVVGLW